MYGFAGYGLDAHAEQGVSLLFGMQLK
jgi:hypothetical protein